MNKKVLLILILLIVVAVGITTFLRWPRVEPVEPLEIKIAESYSLLLFIAMEKGFFEEENLRVRSKRMLPEHGALALLREEVDYTIFNEIFNNKPLIEEPYLGAPIKTTILTARHYTFFLVARPDLELNELQSIAIYSRHTPQHYGILKFIEEHDLEVEIIAPGPKEESWFWELPDLLLMGEVDGLVVAMPSSALQMQNQGFPILETLVYTLPSGLSVRNDKIEKNPEEIQKVVRALEQAMEFIVTEPEETKELFLKFWELEKTEENFQFAEEFYSFIKTAHDRTNVPYDEGAELLIKLIKAGEFETVQEVEEQVVTQEELDKVFDFRFVK